MSGTSPTTVAGRVMPKGDVDAGVGNAKNSASTNTSSCQPTGATPNRPIWCKYMEVADNWDRGMMEKWKTNMNNLLIFAALFTAIVTAFILDALPDLKNMSTSTSSQQSSILTINTLWFLSITSSLAATTWAIICLEWCAFLTNVTKAEDYEEMAEKRQRKLEAMQRWKMDLILAAIPLFLHFSLFSFLAGLWFRLRDINKEIGFVVGIPGLVLASTYVVVAFLPVVTDAPFSTSASEVIELIIHGIRYIAGHCRFIRPPRILSWALRCLFTCISTLFQTLHRIAHPLHIPHIWTATSAFAKYLCRGAVSYIDSAWKTIIWFLPFIFPTYMPDPYPFDELNKLKLGRPDSDKRLRLRALLWLMNTPLSREEVKDILKELPGRYDTTDWGSQDRSIIKLLVSSVSSLMENDDISHDEEPIFHHCTTILAEEIDKAFDNGGDFQRIYFWKSTSVLEKLLPSFHLDESSSEDFAYLPSATIEEEDYWLQRAVPALLFCPLPKTIEYVARKLDSTKHVTQKTLLRIVRGLHVATLACADSNQSVIEEIPDLGIWSWDSSSLDRNLDRALLQFLQSLFATLRKDDHPPSVPRLTTILQPTTIPSFVLSCLKVLDEKPGQYPPKIHSALCLLVALACRSDPLVFEGEGSFTNDLLTSAELYKECGGKGGLQNARRLIARLRAVACGPKPLTGKDIDPLARLEDYYSRLHDSVKADQQCLKGFLDAYAATLEAVVSVNGPPTAFTPRRNANTTAVRNTFANPLFTQDVPFNFVHEDPNCRLPYIYSLAIAFTYGAEEWNRDLSDVAKFFVLGNENSVTLDRALDTNILVVSVLGFIVPSQPEAEKRELGKMIIQQLEGMIRDGTDWRTRWKSIYLIADLTSLLSQIDMLEEAENSLNQAASKAIAQVESEHVPSDWGRKKRGLERCDPESKVKALVRTRGEARQGVYEWIGRKGVPYLSLYHLSKTTPEPILYAVRWALYFAAMANKR